MTERPRYPWESSGEILTVDTPEQTRVDLRIAPFGARIAAALLDKILVVLLSLVPIVAAFLTMASSVDLDREVVGYLVAVSYVVQFLVSLFYWTWAELRGEGRTFGKRRLGLRTVLADGRGPTLAAAFIRNLARVVDELPVLWLVPAFAGGQRRIGDLLAGTFVIVDAGAPVATARGRWLSRLAPTYREIRDRQFLFTAQHAAVLFADDLNLLEYLEERLMSVPTTQRRPFFVELSARYVARLSLEAEQERVARDPERFLQELGLFLRERFQGHA